MTASHRITCDDGDGAGDGLLSHAAVTSPYSVASPLTKSDTDVASFPCFIPLKTGMLVEKGNPCKVEKSNSSRVRNSIPVLFNSEADLSENAMLDLVRKDTGYTDNIVNQNKSAILAHRDNAVGHVRCNDRADVPPVIRVAESLRSATLHSRTSSKDSVEGGRTVREIATDIKKRPLNSNEKAPGPISFDDVTQNKSFEDDRILFEEKIQSLQQLVESQSRSVWELRDLTASLRLGNDQSSMRFYHDSHIVSIRRIFFDCKACNVR